MHRILQVNVSEKPRSGSGLGAINLRQGFHSSSTSPAVPPVCRPPQFHNPRRSGAKPRVRRRRLTFQPSLYRGPLLLYYQILSSALPAQPSRTIPLFSTDQFYESVTTTDSTLIRIVCVFSLATHRFSAGVAGSYRRLPNRERFQAKRAMFAFFLRVLRASSSSIFFSSFYPTTFCRCLPETSDFWEFCARRWL